MCTFDFSILEWALIPHLRPRALALGLVEVAPAGQSWALIPHFRSQLNTNLLHSL